jgi:glycosyltransferase involved in cell wall biosynthesis
MKRVEPFILGIDATNLRSGGGVTHLVELLNMVKPGLHGVNRVIVWGCKSTLNALEEKPWLTKLNPPLLDQGLFKRVYWQRFFLSKAARYENCDLLFVPGGSYVGNFHPVVVMSQNLLPFEIKELLRFGWTFFTLKLLFLRFTQSRSFQKANGIIFLTKYARDIVLGVTGNLSGQISIVPHGLNSRFNRSPKLQKNIITYNKSNPYRVLYVSTIDQYKHQWNVVKAIAILRKKGFPISIDLIGPAYSQALMRLNLTIESLGFVQNWVRYHGNIPFNKLHHQYAQADLGLFASSCENMPNILLEKMASGLPIACSNKGPMPEILGNSGVYFDPEKPYDIARALLELINSSSLRAKLAKSSYTRAQKYSWLRCANETFKFLNEVLQRYKGAN